MRLSDHLSGASNTATLAGNSALLRPSGPIREVILPGSTKSTPQLAFGCAYLLGPGLDWNASRRLLDAAWDAGIRHFDVARLYGQGRTEALLGEFLRDHPSATVTTKYGLVPPTTPQRIALALQRRIPFLQNVYERNEKARYTAADASASLDLSLRLFGRDHIELFLLHEPAVEDLAHDDLLAFLESARQAGKIDNFGIGGEFYRVEQLFRERPLYTKVLQFEYSIFGPFLNLPSTPTGGPSRIHYRTFTRASQALSRRFARDPQATMRWSSFVGLDLSEPAILSRLLLKAALDEHPSDLALFSTRSENHIFDNIAVASDHELTAPSKRLFELARTEDLGITAELYSSPKHSKVSARR
jgi:hypothetical protein